MPPFRPMLAGRSQAVVADWVDRGGTPPEPPSSPESVADAVVFIATARPVCTRSFTSNLGGDGSEPSFQAHLKCLPRHSLGHPGSFRAATSRSRLPGPLSSIGLKPPGGGHFDGSQMCTGITAGTSRRGSGGCTPILL